MVTIQISTSGASFDENPGDELARIFGLLIRTCEDAKRGDSARIPLRDINGNTVGHADISIEAN